jgi:hypothetical protein
LRKMRGMMADSFGEDADNERLLGALGVAYGVAYLFYNITEATFQGLNFLFVVFLILAVKYPGKSEQVTRTGSRMTNPEVVTAGSIWRAAPVDGSSGPPQSPAWRRRPIDRPDGRSTRKALATTARGTGSHQRRARDRE